MATINLDDLNKSIKKKLNKKELEFLNNVLKDLNKAQNYLLKENVVVGSIVKSGNGLSYFNKQGEAIDVYNKVVGIDLCYLYHAKNNLEKILK